MLISASFRHVRDLTDSTVWSIEQAHEAGATDECVLRPALLTGAAITEARERLERLLVGGDRQRLAIEVRMNPKHPGEVLASDLVMLRHVFPLDDIATRAVRGRLERASADWAQTFDAAITATTEALAEARQHARLSEAAGGHEVLSIEAELVTPYTDALVHMLNSEPHFQRFGPFVALVRFGTVRQGAQHASQCDVLLLGGHGMSVPSEVEEHVLAWTAGWRHGWSAHDARRRAAEYTRSGE